jgi:calcineurin-like phosphoesterase
MVGSRDSCLGVKTDIIIQRWLTDQRSRNELEVEGEMQFCALLIDIDTATAQATGVEQVLKFV